VVEHRKDPVSVDDDENVENVEPESRRKLWCSGVNVKQPRFRDVQGIKQIVVLNSGDNDDDETI
jgi:hypothetical protein